MGRGLRQCSKPLEPRLLHELAQRRSSLLRLKCVERLGDLLLRSDQLPLTRHEPVEVQFRIRVLQGRQERCPRLGRALVVRYCADHHPFPLGEMPVDQLAQLGLGDLRDLLAPVCEPCLDTVTKNLDLHTVFWYLVGYPISWKHL